MISIRRRLTHDVLVVSAVLLGGSLAALYAAARTELAEQFDAALRAKALALSALVGEGEGMVHLDFADKFLLGTAGGRPGDVFELWDAEGRRLARSPALGAADLPLRAGSVSLPELWNLRLPDGRSGRAIGIKFTAQPETHERGHEREATGYQLVVASSREDFEEALTALLGIAGTSSVLLLGATLWTVPRLLRRGLAPLDHLGDQASQIDANRLTERFPATGLPAELQPISARLNALLARLEESMVRERRFSADLAHELRTPLAELQGLAESALKWPDSRDPATDGDVLAIARQMKALVVSLLALARGEHGQLAARREPVAVDQVMREVWRPFAVRAESISLRTDLDLRPALAVADPVLLRSILTNLFDNAVDYTPAGGVVTLTVETGASLVTVRVANTTANLEASDLGRLFDRFWRKESARSGDRHTGLGLPLARMFATAMNWTITAALDGEHRLVFTLSGPVAG
jgi:two-component system sensor histidine kinase QseC